MFTRPRTRFSQRLRGWLGTKLGTTKKHLQLRPEIKGSYLRDSTGEKWSGRVDSNHRPPGPEPGALARLSHAPRLSAAIQVYHLGCSLTIPRAGLPGSGAPGPTRLQRKRTRAASNTTTAFGAFSLDRGRGGPPTPLAKFGRLHRATMSTHRQELHPGLIPSGRG